jgi:hypothetical protein
LVSQSALTDYTKKLAWLHASPDKDYKSNARQSRAEKLQSISPSSLKMPEIETHQRVIQWLDEIGFYVSGANGPQVLPWTEIAAWSEMTQTAITPSEAILIRKLSSEYVGQYFKSADPIAPDPTTDASYDTLMAAANIEAAFG